MDRLSMQQGKMVDKCGSVVIQLFLDKMLKMVKTMGKTTTEIDLMIARFIYIYISLHILIILLYISFIYIYIYIYTIQFSTNLIIHALYKNI